MTKSERARGLTHAVQVAAGVRFLALFCRACSWEKRYDAGAVVRFRELAADASAHEGAGS